MKKLIILAVMAFVGTAAQAQIYESSSSTKKKSEVITRFYVRASAGLNTALGANTYGDGRMGGSYGYPSDVSGIFGGALGIGIQRTIGKNGLYWGAEAGLATHGCQVKYGWPLYDDMGGDPVVYQEEETQRGAGVYLVPNLGWRFNIGNNLWLDPHVGVFGYFSWDPAGHDYGNGVRNEWESLDFGAAAGVGLWIGKFNIDLQVRGGFVEMSDDARTLSVLAGIGYQF